MMNDTTAPGARQLLRLLAEALLEVLGERERAGVDDSHTVVGENNAQPLQLYAYQYEFNVTARVARDRSTLVAVHVAERVWIVLQVLAERGHATSAELAAVPPKVSPDAVRSAIDDFRRRLSLAEDELIVSTAGRGGGYRLAPGTRDPSAFKT